MRSLSRRAVLGLTLVCLFFAAVIVAVGLVGISGIRSTTQHEHGLVGDELATASATATAARAMDAAHIQGDQLLLSSGPERSRLQQTLFDSTIPAADGALATVLQRHAGDGPEEQEDLRLFATQWRAVRTLLGPSAPSGTGTADLDAAYAPLDHHIDALLAHESADARSEEHEAAETSSATTWVVAGAVLLSLVVAAGIARAGVRRIRAAVEPENEQLEFTETLQVADSEREAHELLKHHIERTLVGSAATVLNRNNSADRLEAMTPVPADSALARGLQNAEPRSCLAIRAGRVHVRDGDRQPLLGCLVCGHSTGSSSCTPLTVSGEVIGSVLVTSASARTEEEQQRVRDSVSQAAPVLANLRNIAIAELRAATDSLTGLPNKRAVADNLKRMLAQASRTLTPMALLLIDLDHFKNINDRLGHPVGDQALANVGAAVKSALRSSDFGGRNGGEEFAVLLPDTDLEGASLAAEKIRAAIADIELPGVDLVLTASIGIAIYPDHALSAERLERLADAALYTAKRAGRNRVVTAELPSEPLDNTTPIA